LGRYGRIVIKSSTAFAEPVVSHLDAARVRIQMLGTLHVTTADRDAAAVTQPRRLALLAYLVLAEPRGLHSRDTLMALLWPEATTNQGRQALRNSLHELRKALGDEVIVTAGHDFVGVASDQIECDVECLERDMLQGRVIEALERYGELLSGFHVSGAPEFERWLDGERDALRRRVVEAALTAATRHGEAGEVKAALGVLRQVYAIDPDDEHVLRRCLEATAASGDLRGALRMYSAFTARLASELDAVPAPETTSLMASLTTQYGVRMRDGAAPSDFTLPTTRANLLALDERLTAASVPASDSDDEAYVLYVRGTYLFLRAAHVGGSVDDLKRCREYFERALVREPEFALAYAGLSNYYAVSAARNLLRPFREHFDRAISLSHRALELDPLLAIPHVHFGVQAMYLESNWDVAGEEVRRAVALDPRYAEARRFLGIYLGATGDRDGGIRELREAVRVEPYMPLFRNSLADALLATGAYDEAIAELRAALLLDSGYKAARARLVRCLEHAGRYADAIDERRIADGAEATEPFVLAFARDGADGYRRQRAQELRAVIANLTMRLGAGTPENAADLLNAPELQLALSHAELGEWDQAFAWEERASASQPARRLWFTGRPELDPLNTTGFRFK